MNRKWLLTLVIALALLLGSFSVARASAPQPVGGDWCVVWLPDPTTWNWYAFPGEGKLIYNAQNNIWNLTCTGVFDYAPYATWDEFCNWIPGSCRGDRLVANKLEYFHDYFDGQEYLWTDIGFANLIVLSNGEARWNAQISYNCQSYYEMDDVTLELPAGYWQPGMHDYTIQFYYEDGSFDSTSVTFVADPGAPIYRGQVRLGLYALGSFWAPVDSINPAQDTYMQVTSWGPSYFYPHLDYAIFTIDGGDPITVDAGPVRNMCSTQHINLFMRQWGPKY